MCSGWFYSIGNQLAVDSYINIDSNKVNTQSWWDLWNGYQVMPRTSQSIMPGISNKLEAQHERHIPKLYWEDVAKRQQNQTSKVSDYAHYKNKNPKSRYSTHRVTDHTKIKNPRGLVNTTNQPRRLIRGSYRANKLS